MDKYIASISFGKDSLAMLLMLIEKGYKIDEVIFYDTGMEFRAIYEIRDKVTQLLANKNIEYTELKPKTPFINKMFNIKVHKRDGTIQYGYGLCRRSMQMGNYRKEHHNNRILKSQI